MLPAIALFVATGPKFPLTIESIMRGPALVGHAPRGLRWSADGKQLGFQWAKADGSADPAYKSYVVNRDGADLKSGSLPSVERTPPASAQTSGITAYESGGDIFIKNLATSAITQVTKTSEGESSPRLTSDGKSVVFLKGGNVFRADISGGPAIQLTDLKTSGPFDGEPLLTSIDEPPSIPVAIKVPAGFRAGAFVISPTGGHATLDLTQPATGGKRTQVANFVTSSGYLELLSGYEKVGAPQSHSKILAVDLSNGAITEIVPARPGRIFGLRWAPDGKHAIAWARSEDHKDDWVLGFDPASDKVATLWDEHDDAWVGGPGRGTMGWLPDGSKFYFESEHNGYANLYEMAPEGGEPIPIAAGKFEVSDVRMDTEHSRFTYVSSEPSPFKREVDAIGFDGRNHRKLADFSADEDAVYSVSPNGQDIAVVRSTSTRPGELFVNGAQVTHTPTEEFLAGPWIDPPIVMAPSTDGVQVPARLYKPTGWKKGGPAVIFVHGAGYLQNVYEGWSHYFREYMFHHYLMSRGYVVLDMDFRASAGYGKAWRTAIYRHMGGKDLDDQVAGASYLVKELGVAKDRIGIYGGSYGGFLTLMAMFTKPDVFAAGAALRPVSDWANYNHGYTSEILNNPQDDKEAYRQSSPINFAEGLSGSLLICHGMVDTNVHFEDSVRLIERLIELGKRNWEVAPYPVEDHAFEKPASWTDEYLRISDLFDRTIGHRK